MLKYGGALSGEHGDGLVRSPFQEKMFGPVLYHAFRELKRTFDPQGLLNPGKIVDAPPLTAQPALRPGLRHAGGADDVRFLGRRRPDAGRGVVCRRRRVPQEARRDDVPVLPGDREEQHSTRGRANALRLALTGQLDLHGLTDPAVKEVLDLCLECKACKSECPTNVDMARLKAEFLHQYHRKHGLPWRNRLFGHVAPAEPLGQPAGAGVQLADAQPAVRWLAERKLLGIDRRRCPPAFVRRRLRRSIACASGENRGTIAIRPIAATDPRTPHANVPCSFPTRSRTITSRRSAWRRCVYSHRRRLFGHTRAADADAAAAGR